MSLAGLIPNDLAKIVSDKLRSSLVLIRSKRSFELLLLPAIFFDSLLRAVWRHAATHHEARITRARLVLSEVHPPFSDSVDGIVTHRLREDVPNEVVYGCSKDRLPCTRSFHCNLKPVGSFRVLTLKTNTARSRTQHPEQFRSLFRRELKKKRKTFISNLNLLLNVFVVTDSFAFRESATFVVNRSRVRAQLCSGELLAVET